VPDYDLDRAVESKSGRGHGTSDVALWRGLRVEWSLLAAFGR